MATGLVEGKLLIETRPTEEWAPLSYFVPRYAIEVASSQTNKVFFCFCFFLNHKTFFMHKMKKMDWIFEKYEVLNSDCVEK